MRIYTKIQLVVELNLVFFTGLPTSSKRTPKTKRNPWLSWTRRFKF